MVKIRLRRVGAKKQPSYRIVISESTSPRDGRFIEVVGHYNPRTEPETVVVNAERAAYWLSHGAQPTEAVERLLKKQGVYDILAGGAASAAPTAAPAPAAGAPTSAPTAAPSVAIPTPPAVDVVADDTTEDTDTPPARMVDVAATPADLTSSEG